MNTRQRIILGVGIALVAVMALFPPWRRVIPFMQGGEYPTLAYRLGPGRYGFIASAPDGAAQVDIARFAVQFVALVTIIGGLVALAGGRGKDGGA